MSRGRTVVTPRTGVSVSEDGKKFAVVKDGVSLQQLVDGLNGLGIGPRDLIGILQAIKAAGAILAAIQTATGVNAEVVGKPNAPIFRAALQRAAILSNEKYRGVRVEVSPGQVRINAHNPEQEEAQEEIEAQTVVDNLAIGFNVNYLLDALSALRDTEVVLQLRDANSSALVREAGSAKCRHVVMPLRL